MKARHLGAHLRHRLTEVRKGRHECFLWGLEWVTGGTRQGADVPVQRG